MESLVATISDVGRAADTLMAPLAVPFAPLDAAVAQLAANVGFPADQLKYVLCIIAAIPLGFLFRVLPDSPALKHIFSIVSSISLLTFCVGPSAWLHSLVTSSVVYFLLLVLPHAVAHKAAFAFAMTYLSTSHIYRLWVDWMGWTMDFTGPQMVLTIKLTAIAFNYYDGRCDPKTRSDEQIKRGISKLPSLLEYFGFIYFFPSFLAGPAIEFTDYRAFVSGGMFNKFPGRRAPLAIFEVAKQFAYSLFFVPFLVLSPKYPVDFLAGDVFPTLPLAERFFRFYASPTMVRMKYYFAWYLAECGFIACGAGCEVSFDKLSGKPVVKSWHRFANAVWWRVEFAPNVRSVTTYWNIKTADWLKNYVYLRLTPEGTKPTMLSTLGTYAMSAFWHGFYPGYYLFFLTTAIFTECAKDLRTLLRPKFVGHGNSAVRQYVYDALTIFTTSVFMNYSGISFIMLDARLGLAFFSNLYFSGHIVSIVALILLRTVLRPRRAHAGALSKKAL